jgi:hypothetical protein
LTLLATGYRLLATKPATTSRQVPIREVLSPADIMRGILRGKIGTKMANSLLYATQIASGNVSRWKKVPDDASTGQAESKSKPKEEKVPVMVKLLTEALGDPELESPSGDIRLARELFDEKIKEAVAGRQ